MISLSFLSRSIHEFQAEISYKMSYTILNNLLLYSLRVLLSMKKKCFLFITIQNRVAITSFPYTSTMPGPNVTNSEGLQYEFDMDAYSISFGSYLHLTFQITNPSIKLSSTFMVETTTQNRFTAGMMRPASFYGKSHAELQSFMDLNGMQLGRKQYNNHHKGLQTKLYITVYNIDPDYRRVPVSFRIDLTVTSYTPSAPPLVCFPCYSGFRLSPTTSCLCNNCSPGTYGPDCSINMIPISSGKTTAVTLNGPGLANFRIDESDEVSINVRQRLGVGEVYFQFIKFDGSFASHSNVAIGSNFQQRFLVQAGTNGATIEATSSGTPMSVTVAIYDTTSTIVEINYTVKQKSKILIIVLGVLGGVLFIGLVIAAIYIIRKSAWYNQSRQAGSVQAAIQIMNDEEIQRFFPTVVFKNVEINKNQSTLQNLNDNSKKQTLEDCVICLCPIQKTQQVKVTYCKHIFHSHCLVGWFKKQQSCPFCRQEFTRTNTIKLYKKIKQMNDNMIMKGQQLVVWILAAKCTIVASKESLQYFNQKSQQMTRKIQIGSRNSFEVQSIND